MGNFNILMFGSRKTGKSSILASMIDSFEVINESKNNMIHLKATRSTELLLQAKQDELKKTFKRYERFGFRPFDFDEARTDSTYTYEFTMTAQGSKDSHTITFNDICGEWLMTTEKEKELEDQIAQSQIIIIAIDTPHLMEENGEFNNAFNITNRVYNLLKFIKGKKDIPRMVLFVPIKCEKYYHEGRMDEVNREIKKQYRNLFNNFATPPKNELYTVAITPILTMGGIVFHDYLRDSNGEVETVNNPNIPVLAFRPKVTYYKFYDKAPVFSPKYCEQPVLYLLSFILKISKMTTQTQRKRDAVDYLLDGLYAILNTPYSILIGDFKGLAEMWSDVFKDTELIESAISLSEFVKTEGDGYEIVQNPF